MTLSFEEAELAEARRVNRLLAATPRMPLQTAWDVAVLNGALRLSQALPPPNFRRAGVTLETRKVEAFGRTAEVRILRPVGPCRGVYLDIHGGAWVLGNARMDDALNVDIARTCGVAVVSVAVVGAPVAVPTAVDVAPAAEVVAARTGAPEAAAVVGHAQDQAHADPRAASAPPVAVGASVAVAPVALADAGPPTTP